MDRTLNVILVCLLVLILLAATLFWTRHQIVEFRQGNGFYSINRLTGDIILVDGRLSFKVKNVQETEAEFSSPPQSPEQSQEPQAIPDKETEQPQK